VDHYNLDAIISVGYRVKSAVATRFRIWATQKLRELIVRGFVLDDERLKNPDQPFDFLEYLPSRQRRTHSPAQGNALGTRPPRHSSALNGRHPLCPNPSPRSWFT
jgi:hypothetical protein